MFLQIDLIEAQLMPRHDGAIEIYGRNGSFVVYAAYAKEMKDAYEKFVGEGYPEVESLKIAVNIELPQPIGSFHGKDAASA